MESTSTANGEPAHRDLAPRIDGTVVLPGDAEYDEARRIWNARLDRRPAAIVRCATPDDVCAAVRHARDRGLTLAVRGGGHGYAGHGVCEGGLVIDLSPMDDVSVDPEGRTVRVGAGARWAAVDAATQAHGLATTGGTVSTVGVSGYTLGGGTGHLARAHGFAVDNLRSVELVTAAGERVRAAGDENPGLLWGLRGAGANLGVATTLELRLHEVGPEILAGQVVYPFEHAAEVLRVYRDWIGSAPDPIACYPFILRIPPVPAFPEAFHGRVAIDFVLTYAGPIDEGLAAIEPLRGLAEPVLDAVGAQPYVEVQRMFDAGTPKGGRWYSRSHYLAELPDEAIETIVEHGGALPGDFSMVYLESLGGAAGRVEPGATAFPHRDAFCSLHVFPGWSDPADDDRIMIWAREFHDAMKPWATGGVYVNLLGEDEPDRVRAAYGAGYERLRRLKGRWDPDNLFRTNHNVEPLA